MEAADTLDLPNQISLLVTSLIGGGASVVAAYHLGFFTPIARMDKTGMDLKFVHVLGAFLIFLILQILILPAVLVIYFLLTTGHLPENDLSGLNPLVQGVINILSMVLSFLFVAAYFRYQNRNTKLLIWSRGREKMRSEELKSFLLGGASWMLAYPIVFFVGHGLSLLIHHLLGEPEVEQVAVKALKQMEGFPAVLYGMMACMIILVPAMEELLFRGFLQTWLMGKLRPLYAIFLTSSVFAFFHFSYSQGISNIEYITALLLLSCFLGYLYEKEKSLWAPIGLHVAFNAISILFLLFTDR